MTNPHVNLGVFFVALVGLAVASQENAAERLRRHRRAPSA